MLSISTPVLVLHVKQGYESRATHMEKMLARYGIEFEYILDGDRSEMNQDIVDLWFTGAMNKIDNEASCALKHFYAYQHIVENNLPGALILEDDIVLHKDFVEGCNAALSELEAKVRVGKRHGLISFEDSNLKFVPRSKRQKGEIIYEASRDRFAGCYYVPFECAKEMLEFVKKEKCDLPIDLWHSSLISRIGQPYYWTSPTFATQGSHNGLFPSSISDGSFLRRYYQRISWFTKKCYKHLLYELR